MLAHVLNQDVIMQVCMTCSDPGAYRLHSVGCTAEIRQIKRQDDGVLNIVAKGVLTPAVPSLAVLCW